jgi:5-formyltetrahydrofolate cyclo-ligase
MTKEELRKIYREKRKQLSGKEIEKYNDQILINFQQISLPFLNCIHTFITSERLVEADTSKVIRYLQFKTPGLKIFVPKIDITSGKMQHLHFNDEVKWANNKFGITEPVSGTLIEPGEIDLVLLPLLSFDRKGFRVGYGKGYYDKFLSECRKDVLKIGLSFFEPVDRIDNINQFDIPLNYCVTPQQVFEF